jgi:hypothetical protein
MTQRTCLHCRIVHMLAEEYEEGANAPVLIYALVKSLGETIASMPDADLRQEALKVSCEQLAIQVEKNLEAYAEGRGHDPLSPEPPNPTKH